MVNENDSVEFRNIKGFPGYRVGNDGTVWSCVKRIGRGRGVAPVTVIGSDWRMMKLSKVGKYGHLHVNLGRGNTHRIGPLVLTEFIGPCPVGMECCHSDGDPSNNSLANLRWGTSESNTGDQRLHGTLIGGERHGMAKLTNTQIDEIKALSGVLSQREIAQRFGIKQPHVSDIVNNKKRTASSHAGKGLK